MSRRSYEDSRRVLESLLAIDAGEKPVAPPPLSPADGAPGVHLFGAMLAKAKLEHLTLPGTFISRSEIRDLSFRDTDLTECTAHWNDFIHVNFSGADLSRSDLRGCVFERVRFVGAALAGVDFRYCGFKKCDFTGAEVTDMKLTAKLGAALKLSREQQSVIDWQADDGEEPAGG